MAAVRAMIFVVRGRASGTPQGPLFGVDGKGFDIMSIDIHRVQDGRIVESYHVEDWAGALRQLSAKRRVAGGHKDAPPFRVFPVSLSWVSPGNPFQPHRSFEDARPVVAAQSDAKIDFP